MKSNENENSNYRKINNVVEPIEFVLFDFTCSIVGVMIVIEI